MNKGQKFRKVYSEKSSNFSERKRPSFLRDSLFPFLKREWFPVASGIVNAVTVLVLFLTLWTMKDANELSRKTLLASHTTWLSMTKMDVTPIDDETFKIEYVLVNHSDSPALGLRAYWSHNKRDISDNVSAYKQNALMPHDQGTFMFIRTPKDATEYTKLTKEGYPFYFIFVYQDEFGRNYRIVQGGRLIEGRFKEISFDFDITPSN